MDISRITSRLRMTRKRSLFDGHADMFIEAAQTVRSYGEFGVGLSTEWVARNTDAWITSVDTSLDWVRNVGARTNRQTKMNLIHVDLGPVGDWGRPIDLTRRRNSLEYVNAVFAANEQHDLVLIDGRFRVACFLTSLLHLRSGAQIIFDDYTYRPHYHVAAEFAPVIHTCGRQAMFSVPDKLDRAELLLERDRFLYVVD